MDRVIEGAFTVDVRYNETKDVIVKEDWWKGGLRHRDGKPSYVIRDSKSGLTVTEHWHHEGHVHRSGDRPAETNRDPSTGNITKEVYRLWGRLGREAGPALIKKDPKTGQDILREWYHGDLIGRPDLAPPGPSREEIDPSTGVVTLEQYHYDGMLHRNDGPAEIQRDPQSGQIISTRYFLLDNEQKPFPAFIAPPEL